MQVGEKQVSEYLRHGCALSLDGCLDALGFHFLPEPFQGHNATPLPGFVLVVIDSDGETLIARTDDDGREGHDSRTVKEQHIFNV